MKGQKMSEVNRVKWSRLKKILEYIQEPKDIKEIEKLIFPNPTQKDRRTLNNYLAELKVLELIEYDEKERTYQKAGVKKVKFTPAEYKNAVKHAKYLILTSNKTHHQRYDGTTPYNVVDLIAFHDTEKSPDWYFDKLVYQHIKTGYNRTIYLDLKRYRDLMDELGLDFPVFPSFNYIREGIEEEIRGIPKPKPEEKLQEIDALKGKLAGIIQRQIVNLVEQGQPLLGKCENCPHLKFSVKG